MSKRIRQQKGMTLANEVYLLRLFAWEGRSNECCHPTNEAIFIPMHEMLGNSEIELHDR